MKILSRVSKRNEEVGSVLESEAGRNSLQVLLEQFQVPISNLGCSISFEGKSIESDLGYPRDFLNSMVDVDNKDKKESVKKIVNYFILAI